jgi:hypothetical protein
MKDGLLYDSGNYRKIGNILQSYETADLSNEELKQLKEFSKRAMDICIAEDDKDTWNLRMFDLDQEVSKFINEKKIRIYRK